MEIVEMKPNNLDRFIRLGLAVSYYRKRKNITQSELAEMVGVSIQHIGALEAPKMVQPISLELLFNIANALQVQPYLLLKFPGEGQEL